MRKALVACPLLLMACATTTAPPPPPPHGVSPSHICQNDGLSAFVGRQATTELGAEMLAASRAGTLRWVPFGAMITMEFSPSRLTVRLDQQNRVASATCG
jgi:Peptidase inhibitor I78 family